MSEVKLTWEEGLLFNVEQDGHSYYIDASVEGGSFDKGIRPKAMLLSALGGCSGMDVVSLLKKMRVTGYSLQIVIKGDAAEEHPKVYERIELAFHLNGDDIPLEKVQKAIELSITKYCPVYIMLSKAVPIKTMLYINDKEMPL